MSSEAKEICCQANILLCYKNRERKKKAELIPNQVFEIIQENK